MSTRTDAGKCRFCGTVALVEDLLEVPTDDGPEYMCERCAEDRGPPPGPSGPEGPG